MYKQFLLMDCNPKHPRHWLYQWCLLHRDPSTGADVPADYVEPESGQHINLRFHSLHWTPYDNASHLSASYIEQLKSLPPIKRRRLLDGEWCSNEGAVFSEFDDSTHVCEPFMIPNSWHIYRAIDFGYRNPFVCLWVAKNPDGILYVFAEHYQAEMIINDHAKIIKARSEGFRIDATVSDWEAEQRANLEDQGISINPAPNCKNIRLGIDKVHEYLCVRKDGKPSLYIFNTCSNTINEFFSYEWGNSKTDRNEAEEPLDKNNHSMSCLRYLITFLCEDRSSSFSPIRNDDEREAVLNGF